MKTPENAEAIRSAIKSWATLQPLLMEINDLPTLEWMMYYEQISKNRIRIIDRVYSRWNKLRQELERRALSKGQLPFTVTTE